MREQLKKDSECVLWIDHTNRIISFKNVVGFTPMEFPRREEKINYALLMSAAGYRIE